MIAVDIGNSRMKLGRFAVEQSGALPEPEKTLRLSSGAPPSAELDRWLEAKRLAGPLEWHIGSVCRPATTRLLEWIRESRPRDSVVLLSADDVDIEVALAHPDMVGIDRLLDAAAANALRTPGRPAVVVDVGTAITVDFLDASGVFQGGAILPGIAMSALALHEFTDLLPRLEMNELLEPPEPVGRDTVAAMRSGLFWGALGAVVELSRRMADASAAEPEIYLTGGAGRQVAPLLGKTAKYVPELTLGGIVLTAR